ncbi:MAG: DotU family type IV/VI secretion system protein [Desulfuromonadaceae bacterium]
MKLVDCFMPLIGFVAHFRKNVVETQPEFQQVKGYITQLIAKSEECVKKSSISQTEYDQARFIVCAWIDENILSSNWKEKQQWQKEQLQRIFYNTTDAGVEVFERLNQLDYHQNEVREIFYLCLSLGFKGRFVNQGDEFLLEQLKSSNLKLLIGNDSGLRSLETGDFFPEAYPLQTGEVTQQEKPRFSIMIILAILGPVLLFLILFLIYRFTLGSIASKLF